MIGAPLEQFQILRLLPLKFININLSLTNYLFINLLCLLLVILGVYCNNFNLNSNNYKEDSFFLIPNAWQKNLESIADISALLISDVMTHNRNKYFPFIYLLFSFILFNNLIGLIPYSFTATSHLIVTFTLSFSVFIGINSITIQKYEMKTFSLFLPANTTFLLALLLIPIELISYVAKPISLGVRLFINLMAGHSLLKVIVGFSWSILLLENFTSLGLVLPMIVLVVLFSLELGVALIQAYVFVILTCIYIQDGS